MSSSNENTDAAAPDAGGDTGLIEVCVAGFRRRLMSSLVDAVLVFFPSLAYVSAGLAVVHSRTGLNLIAVVLPPSLLLFCTLTFVYFFLFSWLMGRTPGMLLCRSSLVHRSGTRPMMGASALRSLSLLLFSLPFLIGFLWILFDVRRRGLHDVVSGTYVTMER